jgi:hypothetical protein
MVAEQPPFWNRRPDPGPFDELSPGRPPSSIQFEWARLNQAHFSFCYPGLPAVQLAAKAGGFSTSIRRSIFQTVPRLSLRPVARFNLFAQLGMG